jgi:uncharacterized membrane protein required for colicin V production
MKTVKSVHERAVRKAQEVAVVLGVLFAVVYAIQYYCNLLPILRVHVDHGDLL